MPRSRARCGFALAIAFMAFPTAGAFAEDLGSPDLSGTPNTSGPCGQEGSCLVIQTTAPDGVKLTASTAGQLTQISLKKAAGPLPIKPAVARAKEGGGFSVVSLGTEIAFPDAAGEHSVAIDPPLAIGAGEYPALFYPQGSFANENADIANYQNGNGWGITYFTGVSGPGDYSRNFLIAGDGTVGASSLEPGYWFFVRWAMTPSAAPPDQGDDGTPPDQGDGGGDDLEPAVCPRNPSKPSPRPCADLQLTAVPPQDFGARVALEERRKKGDLPRRFRNVFTFSFTAKNLGPDSAVETVITGEALKLPARSGIHTAKTYAREGLSPCSDGGALSEFAFGFSCNVRTLAVNESGTGGAILYLAQAGTVSYSGSTSSNTPDPGPEPNTATLTVEVKEIVTSKGREVKPVEGKPPVFEGQANGAEKVDVAVAKPQGGAKAETSAAGCRWLSNKRAKFETEKGKRCSEPVWLEARGTGKWKFKMKKPLPVGKYVLLTRATGAQDQVEFNQDERYGNRVEFRVR